MKTDIIGTPKGIGTEALHIAGVINCPDELEPVL